MKLQNLTPSVAVFAALTLFGLSLKAQLRVDANGNVGIGTTTPSAKLHVEKANTTSSYMNYFLNTSAPAGTKYGTYHYVTSAGTSSRYGTLHYTYAPTGSTSTYGFYNYTPGNDGTTYGIYNSTYQNGSTATGGSRGIYNYLNTGTSSTAYADYNYLYSASGGTGVRYANYNYVSVNGTGTHYGVYANTSGATNYAGYFDGNVHVNGNLTSTSDERKKENVQTLSGALSLVARLQPHTYTYKKNVGMNLPEGTQYGFVAQELETVLPSLVVTSEHPVAPSAEAIAPMDEKDVANGAEPSTATPGEMSTETVKSVNYMAMIPILTQAIKEQQAQIDAQRAEIEALRREIGNR